MRRVFAALIMSLAGPALARDFLLPVDCTLGDTCFIQQYVDRDAGPGIEDFACGKLSYDGHSGTDFSLLSEAQMREGVAVQSIAAGEVTAYRDGVPDLGAAGTQAARDAGQNCGNGLVIDHDDGWQSQYCHLRSGSVTLRPGDTIEPGQTLGLIGQSGEAEFPHLHLTIRRNGETVDPFQPDNASCGAQTDQLWADPLPYVPTDLVTIGWATAIPDFDALMRGDLPVNPDREAPALVVWTMGFGSKPGDTLTLEISGPDGQIFRHTDVLERTQARYMRAGGLRLRADQWTAGQYSAVAQLNRAGDQIAERRITLDMVP